MFCIHCRNQLPDQANFCPACGKPVSKGTDISSEQKIGTLKGQAISEAIECVIGMSKKIGDEAAISFAAYFYSALGFGRSVKEAFDQGKTALMLEGIPEENTPVLLHKQGVDPATVKLIQV